MSLLYFAYGSNLWQRRLEFRVGKVRVHGSAMFLGHVLSWRKKSKDVSGKCDVVKLRGVTVHGVVYHMRTEQLPALDKAEGLGAGYEREAIEVQVRGRAVTVQTYSAQRDSIDPSQLAYDWYRAFVVEGLRLHGLSAQYRSG